MERSFGDGNEEKEEKEEDDDDDENAADDVKREKDELIELLAEIKRRLAQKGSVMCIVFDMPLAW